MTTRITHNQSNNSYTSQKNYNLKSLYKDDIYKQQIKKYVDDVINVVINDLIKNFNPHPNALKKYVYTIGNLGKYTLLKHPQLPDEVIYNLQCVYKNDIERIYPINELMEELKEKFSNYKIILNLEKTTITIDWS